MQKHVNLVDLVKSLPTNIFLQNFVSIRPRTSPVKFEWFGPSPSAHLPTKAATAPAATAPAAASRRAA